MEGWRDGSALAALSEDHSSVPSNCMERLITACDSRTQTPSSDLYSYPYMFGIYSYRQEHIHKNKNKINLKNWIKMVWFYR